MKNPYTENNRLKTLTPERLMMIFIIALLSFNVAKRELLSVQLKNIPMIENHIAQDDFCKWSLQRMIEMTPVKETLTNDIYYIFKNSDNPLKLNSTDKIIFEKSFNDSTSENCKLITRSIDGELRGFIFNLKSSPERPFYYQIDNITDDVPSSELYEKQSKSLAEGE